MDLGLIHASGISQSVPERDEGFAKEMAGKVVQTVICDLVDEFKRFCKEPLI